MSKLLALAYSDIHKHAFQAYAKYKYDRLQISLDVEELIARRAKVSGVPVIFCGDYFHNPKELDNYTIQKSLQHFKQVFEEKDIDLFAISGNHDLSEKNLVDNNSPSYIQAFNVAFNKFHNLDNKTILAGNLAIHGIPYTHDDDHFFNQLKEVNNQIVELKAYTKILLLHRDIPGAITPSGYQVEDTKGWPNRIDKLWKNFDWVLCGHIHKPMKLSKKCIMLGSPIHQNQGDVGCEMGYWKIYDDKVEFKPLSLLFPNFVQLKPGEVPCNTKDYFIPAQEVITVKENTSTFSTSFSPKKLVKKYFKAKGIKNKARRNLLTEILNTAKNANN